MSGAGGKWLASTVKEEHIAKLRSAGYLSGDIAHRLSAKGQIIPTAEHEERMVFLSHFIPLSRVSCSTTT